VTRPGSLLYRTQLVGARLVLPLLDNLGFFKFPRTVRLESTANCNADCITCTRQVMMRKKGVMDFALFKKVVDECASYKVSSIHLHNFGEPFIDNGIFDKIRYATGKGISTRLFSNISLLDRAKATELVKSGLTRIKVSIDGNSKETFDAIRKGLDFDKVVENIDNLIEVKKELGSKTPEIGLVFVETEKNSHEREGFMARWKGRVDSIDISSYHNWGGSLSDGERGERGDKRGLPCLRVWQTFTVLWNGDVSICCMDYDGKVILGNVKKSSVYDIFHGEKLRRIRRRQLKGDFMKPKICQPCEARR